MIIQESSLYQAGGYLTYCCSPDLGMTILTDTTERAPTFGVTGIENKFEQGPFALANVSIENGVGAESSFKMILGRNAFPLEWDDFNTRAGKKRLSGFDLSEQNAESRENNLSQHVRVTGQKAE